MSEQKKTGSPGNSSLSSTKQLLDELDALMQRMLALPVGNEAGPEKSANSPATSVMDAPPRRSIEPDSTHANPLSPPTGDGTEVRRPIAPRQTTEAAQSTANEELEKPHSYYYEQAETNDSEEATGQLENRERFSEQFSGEPSSDLEETEKDHGETDSDEVNSTRARRTIREFHSPIAENLPIITSERLAALTACPPVLESEPLIKRSKLLKQGEKQSRRWWLWPLSLLNRTFDIFTYLLGPLGSWLRQPSGRAFLGWVGLALLLASIVLQIIFWIRDN